MERLASILASLWAGRMDAGPKSLSRLPVHAGLVLADGCGVYCAGSVTSGKTALRKFLVNR